MEHLTLEQLKNENESLNQSIKELRKELRYVKSWRYNLKHPNDFMWGITAGIGLSAGLISAIVIIAIILQ